MALDRAIWRSYVGGGSILVAEQEPLARTSLSELFRFEGNQVYEAADSHAAISHINNDAATKVIMLDAEMPSWRSVTTYALSKLPTAIIVAMSTQDWNYAAQEAQRLGVHEYLVKPLSFDHICQTILHVLQTRHDSRR